MTIHSGHPFATPPGERAPLRRLRGRLSSAVSVWTTATDAGTPVSWPSGGGSAGGSSAGGGSAGGGSGGASPADAGPVGERPADGGAAADAGGQQSRPQPGEWAGLTVSSFVVVDGQPGALVGMVDPDSEFAGLVARTGRAAVSLLTWAHRDVADVHAGLVPSPGGVFRTGWWEATPWGPVLTDAAAWVGGEVVAESTRDVGWSRLLEVSVEHVHVGEHDESAAGQQPLVHRRGRYERG